jgi:hypothetical protein
MSLSTLATTSFSSAHDSTLPPSAFELRHIILDSEAVEKFEHVFSEDATSMSQLRHISFVSQNIKRLEYDLDCHHKEEREFYDHIMKDEAFRNPLQLVTHDYRRRTRAKGFHPYHHRPLTPPPPSVSPKSSRNRPPPESPPSSSSCTTDQSTSYESGMSIVRAYMEQERQQSQPGSSGNPIVVDVSEQEEQLTVASCEFCAHLEQSQRLCTHYDMSPKRRQFLRRKMGLSRKPRLGE